MRSPYLATDMRGQKKKKKCLGKLKISKRGQSVTDYRKIQR